MLTYKLLEAMQKLAESQKAQTRNLGYKVATACDHHSRLVRRQRAKRNHFHNLSTGQVTEAKEA